MSKKDNNQNKEAVLPSRPLICYVCFGKEKTKMSDFEYFMAKPKEELVKLIFDRYLVIELAQKIEFENGYVFPSKHSDGWLAHLNEPDATIKSIFSSIEDAHAALSK